MASRIKMVVILNLLWSEFFETNATLRKTRRRKSSYIDPTKSGSKTKTKMVTYLHPGAVSLSFDLLYASPVVFPCFVDKRSQTDASHNDIVLTHRLKTHPCQ